jgi:threonine synthase
MPSDTPSSNIIECQQTGANVTLIDGLITDCGRIVSDRKEAEGWFDVSTLKEPYQVEGKKTMGYELAEQLGWELPDVILYPTGGGTGLRVPRAIGDFMMLDILRNSGGSAVAVTDEELLWAVKESGAAEGIFVTPEGGACLPTLKQLISQGKVSRDERVVLFNSGSGLKYLEAFGMLEQK